MIQQGHLPAQKLAGRWWIESQHLPLSEDQQRSSERKQHQLRVAVEDALDIEPENTRPRRYSVRDLKAFQIALPLHRKAQAEFDADDSSCDAMPPAVS